jgi:hypothetical protein
VVSVKLFVALDPQQPQRTLSRVGSEWASFVLTNGPALIQADQIGQPPRAVRNQAQTEVGQAGSFRGSLDHEVD